MRLLNALSARVALTLALKKGGEGEKPFSSLKQHSTIKFYISLGARPILRLQQACVYHTFT